MRTYHKANKLNITDKYKDLECHADFSRLLLNDTINFWELGVLLRRLILRLNFIPLTFSCSIVLLWFGILSFTKNSKLKRENYDHNNNIYLEKKKYLYNI